MDAAPGAPMDGFTASRGTNPDPTAPINAAEVTPSTSAPRSYMLRRYCPPTWYSAAEIEPSDATFTASINSANTFPPVAA
jgi:hypothetical protein